MSPAFLSHPYSVTLNFVFLPLMCSFLIHQCYLCLFFRRGQPSLITSSEQPIMRFLIWQTGSIIYAEMIRHKHMIEFPEEFYSNTFTRLTLIKYSVFLLFLKLFFFFKFYYCFWKMVQIIGRQICLWLSST